MSDPFRVTRVDGEPHLSRLMALYEQCWWARGRARSDVERMLAASEHVALEDAEGTLVAFARVVTDYVYKALILDVVVDERLRGQRLGQRIVDALLDHPKLGDVRHFELYCMPDMVPFYERWGFETDPAGVRFMRRTAQRDAG